MSEAPFIHSHALVEPGVQIGLRTRVWTFVHILPGARIGADCNICDHVFIENDVVIGDRVTVKCGIYIWNGVSIGDDVFLGPNVVFTNDLFPRSKRYISPVPTYVQQFASIGANATVLPGVTIGYAAMIGSGTVVTRDVPPFALIVGNPRDEQPQPVFFRFDNFDADARCAVNRRSDAHHPRLYFDRNAVGTMRAKIEIFARFYLLIKMKKRAGG